MLTVRPLTCLIRAFSRLTAHTRFSTFNARPPGTRPQPAQGPDDAELQVVPVPLPLLSEISLLRITVPADLRPSDNRKAVLLSLQVGVYRQLLLSQQAHNKSLLGQRVMNEG